MEISGRFGFISILVITQSAFAQSFGSPSANAFATSTTDIVTSTQFTTVVTPAPKPEPVQPPPPQTGPQIPQITVDLTTQTAKIWYVGQPAPIEVKISTGGTLKKPDGNDRLQDGNLDPYQIYCGHWETRRARGGVVATPFEGRMDQDGSRDEKYTTYRNYVSGAFDNGDGTGGINMPYAIRVPREIQEQITGTIVDNSTRRVCRQQECVDKSGRTVRRGEELEAATTIDCDKSPNNRRCAPRAGIFIHERPNTNSARENLGHAVSGGCIRLPKKGDDGLTFAPAQLLHEQTNKYGGINIEIVNTPPAEVERSCNQKIVNHTRDQVVATRLKRDRDFGRRIYCSFADCDAEDLAKAQAERQARTARLERQAAGRN